MPGLTHPYPLPRGDIAENFSALKLLDKADSSKVLQTAPANL